MFNFVIRSRTQMAPSPGNCVMFLSRLCCSVLLIGLTLQHKANQYWLNGHSTAAPTSNIHFVHIHFICMLYTLNLDIDPVGNSTYYGHFPAAGYNPTIIRMQTMKK